MGILDLVFPKKCVGCGQLGAYVCEECSVGMWEEEQICPSCRRNSRYGLRHTYCTGPLDGLTCLWAYEGLARKLISNAKYKYLFDQLGELVKLDDRTEFEYLRRFLDEKPVVVPVPLHPKRQRERGFNQAEVVAKLVVSDWLLVVNNLLVRVKDTKQQVGRTREMRLSSMENAFDITPSNPPLTSKSKDFALRVSGGSVLLVDDVWTTGATMSECAKVLKKNLPAGRQVWGLVLAR